MSHISALFSLKEMLMKRSSAGKYGKVVPAQIPRKLLKAAKRVSENAYAPYSRFYVGAAVETLDGVLFVGANMENASYGLTVCAEVGALQAASAAGVLGRIQRIAVVGGPVLPSKNYRPTPTAPCGRCRQLIAEAAVKGRRDIEVWYADRSLRKIKCQKISELLPDSFDAENLRS